MLKPINQRIAFLVEELEKSSNAFAKKIGTSSTTIYNIISGKNSPGFEIIESILEKYPNINPIWLVKGLGEWNQQGTSSGSGDSDFLKVLVIQKDEQIKSLMKEVELYRSKSSGNDALTAVEVFGENPKALSLSFAPSVV